MKNLPKKRNPFEKPPTRCPSIWLIFALGVAGCLFLINLTASWDLAFPFCHQDDWRTIRIFLNKFYAGELTLFDYWSDPVHPAPLFALMLLSNAKYFALRPDFAVRIHLVFQLAIGILITMRMLKHSTALSHREKLLMLLGAVSCSLILFNMHYGTQYYWDRVTHGYLYICVFVLTAVVLERVVNQHSRPWFDILVTLLLFALFSALYIDLMIIFALTIASVLLWNAIRRKSSPFFSLGVALFLVSASFAFLVPISRISRFHIGGSSDWSIALATMSHPLSVLQSFGIGLSSGIINTTALLDLWPWAHRPLVLGATFFAISYLILLFRILFGKRLHRNLFPAFLMVFSLIYMIPVILFRISPIEHGIFCMVIPRYAIFYHVGLIGYTFALYSELRLIIDKHPAVALRSGMVITVTLSMLWLSGLWISHNKAVFLKKRYPLIAEQMRARVDDPTADLSVWVARPEHGDLSEEFALLKKYKLNVFADSLPY